MSIRRRKSYTDNYTVIDRRALEDTRLSWAARGLLAYLISKPDHWIVSASHLANEGDAGKGKIYTLLGELVDKGYATRSRQRNQDGTLGTIDYVISDIAPRRGLPDVVQPDVANPTLVSTDNTVSTETTATLVTVPATVPENRFNDFWKAYPKKRGKKPVSDIWKRKRLDAKADLLIADIANRIRNDRRWLDGFIPDPKTYLNQERWTDEIELQKEQSNGQRNGRAKTFDEIQADLRATAERLAGDGEAGEGHRTVEADTLSGSVVASY